MADESAPRYGVRAEITGAGGEVWRTVRDRPARLDAAGVRRKALALTEPVLGDRAADFVALAFDPAAASVAELLTTGTPAV